MNDDRQSEARAALDLGGFTPRVGIVLGSGLGRLADGVQDARVIDFVDVPGFPAASVVGHAGRFVFGTMRGVPVAVMQGRLHAYEGHALDEVVRGVRLIRALGAETLLLTNAAGALDISLSAGDLLVITDHLNLTGRNPLVGPNDRALGPRFPDMTNLYDAGLRAELHAAATAVGTKLRDGVYAGVLGPSYETPAEVRMLRSLGGSAVGMSTVLEAIAAHHAGLRVAGLSCITNLAAGLRDEPLSHTEVQEAAHAAADRMSAVIEAFIAAHAAATIGA